MIDGTPTQHWKRKKLAAASLPSDTGTLIEWDSCPITYVRDRRIFISTLNYHKAVNINLTEEELSEGMPGSVYPGPNATQITQVTNLRLMRDGQSFFIMKDGIVVGYAAAHNVVIHSTIVDLPTGLSDATISQVDFIWVADEYRKSFAVSKILRYFFNQLLGKHGLLTDGNQTVSGAELWVRFLNEARNKSSRMVLEMNDNGYVKDFITVGSDHKFQVGRFPFLRDGGESAERLRVLIKDL